MADIEPPVFYGVGVGPGDPELLTLKAYRIIQQADVISYIANDKGTSQARDIAIEALKDLRHETLEVPIVMSMCDDRILANAIYDEAAKSLEKHLAQGRNVVFLCEGDPLFFASFAYLLQRIEKTYACHVVPGISSMHAASSALCQPLALLKESLAVISGRHDDDTVRHALVTYDTVVIMKAGRSRPRLLRLLQETGRSRDARYLEYIGRKNEVIVRDVTTLSEREGPYFSIFIVLRKARNNT